MERSCCSQPLSSFSFGNEVDTDSHTAWTLFKDLEELKNKRLTSSLGTLWRSYQWPNHLTVLSLTCPLINEHFLQWRAADVKFEASDLVVLAWWGIVNITVCLEGVTWKLHGLTWNQRRSQVSVACQKILDLSSILKWRKWRCVLTQASHPHRVGSPASVALVRRTPVVQVLQVIDNLQNKRTILNQTFTRCLRIRLFPENACYCHTGLKRTLFTQAIKRQNLWGVFLRWS